MASIRHIDTLRAEVTKRGAAVDEWLAAEFGLEMPPPVGPVAQAELAQVMELERGVRIREMLREAFASKAGPAGVDPAALDGNIASVKDYLAGIDDPRALDMLHAAETEGKTRKGVLSAIEARQAELETADEEEEEEEEEAE
jgi:hypothetical protein